MTISLNETVDQVRSSLRDVKWSEGRLQAWVKDAVRDYANFFPRFATLSGVASSGTYTYAFGEVCLGVIACEYPVGEDPPAYPWRHNHLRSAFFNDGISYYDVVTLPGQAQAVLWLSQPESGSSFSVQYLTDFDWTVDGDDASAAVPDYHRPAIVQYTLWCCWREMLTIEKGEAEMESRYNVLAARVDRERALYESLLRSYQKARPAESRVVSWKMDPYDPIG